MALHIPIGHLKTRSGLEPVPRCEPNRLPTSPLADDITTASSSKLKKNTSAHSIIYLYLMMYLKLLPQRVKCFILFYFIFISNKIIINYL